MNLETRRQFDRIKAEIKFLEGVVDKEILHDLGEMVGELYESVDAELYECYEKLDKVSVEER